ncbi:uncharacterized protein LOC113358303 [Papaver somniferum]|uniref:uncharacterized protein LOC113358303 n=1 Tax=Papaver somniferum TaxID=3469 RepID=UPI000E702524|nr:uncharacterized protein LOC113358303 [Papaver somniferum]
MIALWGSAANQVGNDPIDCDSTPCPVLVAVRSTFVKNYQGKITLSSTNATKIYNNVDLKSSKCVQDALMRAHPVILRCRLGKARQRSIFSILTTGKPYLMQGILQFQKIPLRGNGKCTVKRIQSSSWIRIE